jgi:hypothetical protein
MDMGRNFSRFLSIDELYIMKEVMENLFKELEYEAFDSYCEAARKFNPNHVGIDDLNTIDKIHDMLGLLIKSRKTALRKELFRNKKI